MGNNPSEIERECTKCGKIKNLSEYYAHKCWKDSLRRACKSCCNETSKRWRATHPKKKGNNNWQKEHPERAKAASKRYRIAHPEKWAEINRRNGAKKWNTPKGKISISISRRMNKTLKKGVKAGNHWEDLVGYTSEQLRKHIEKQFVEGMTWENYGKYGWHIDHKIPVSAFNFEGPEDIDFKKCWCLKNLQPLWAKDNLTKYAKINKPFQPALTLKE